MRMVEFRKLVDAVVEAHCGLTTACLSDFDLWDYYDEELNDEESKQAARDAAIDLLLEEGFPFPAEEEDVPHV